MRIWLKSTRLLTMRIYLEHYWRKIQGSYTLSLWITGSLKAGVSVEFVAEQMGVSVELVKSWEAGERSPEMAQGFSLSMLYGMSLNDITFNLQAQEA